jgi:hypothetical protein
MEGNSVGANEIINRVVNARFLPTALNVGLSVAMGYSEQPKAHSDYTLAPNEADSLLNNFSLGPHPQRNEFFSWF